MIEVVVYLAVVLGLAAIGVWVGIILAGRIDRRMTPPEADPAVTPAPEEAP